MKSEPFYDYIIVGSGFGGSVSALRLAEKGYKVLVIEKGKWLKCKDFPKTNWQVKKWFWFPPLRWYGLFKLTFWKHVGILSGVGVGGGSLVYANTLPIPKSSFYKSGFWAGLADWETELKPFYETARNMLGTTRNPIPGRADFLLKELAIQKGLENEYEEAEVAVFFGKPGEKVPDPYFGGKGPDRSGCTGCGGCMLGCQVGAKNTLDKNYLYLAQQLGAEILAEKKVIDVFPIGKSDGSEGYRVRTKDSTRFFKKTQEFSAKGVVFSGGVLGTVRLLLNLKTKSLPEISETIGTGIRTNSESLIAITSLNKEENLSGGIAIGSILHTGNDSHLEPCRYPSGSGFWRILVGPYADGKNALIRIGQMLINWIKEPIRNLKALTVVDFGRKTQFMLFMQTLDSTIRVKAGKFWLKSGMDKGKPPTSFIPEAEDFARSYAGLINGKTQIGITETILGIPTTAHILGGAPMGTNAKEGVIDKNHLVFGYQNLMVCDGAAISANPGVNPSLTITALTERAMSLIPPKNN